MNPVLIFAGGVLLGALAGFAVSCAINRRIIRRLRKQVRTLRDGLGEPTQKRETMKVVVWACVLNGFAWVWCSYILAALDKPQIAESLSQVALAEIIAPVVVYAFKSAVENLSKNNHWPDKHPAETQAEPEADTTDGGNAAG